MPEKKTKVKLGLKNLALLRSYFDYIFVHLRQNARLRPELSPKFLSTSGQNPTRKARPDLQLCCTGGKSSANLSVLPTVLRQSV